MTAAHPGPDALGRKLETNEQLKAGSSTTTPAGTAQDGSSGLKLLIEFAPLIVFFVSYRLFDIYWATGVLMASSIGAIIASRVALGHVTPALATTTAVVVLFGLMTLWFRDPRFISMKPTIVNLLFASVLVGGLLTGRLFLKSLFRQGFKLTDDGWRAFTWRWVGFFVAIAALNEVIWRNFAESTWVNFKTFGILPLTILFLVCQMPMLQKHAPRDEQGPHVPPA